MLPFSLFINIVIVGRIPWETDPETDICMNEMHWRMLEGAAFVRAGNAGLAEEGVEPQCSWSRMALSIILPWEKRTRGFIFLPQSTRYGMGDMSCPSEGDVASETRLFLTEGIYQTGARLDSHGYHHFKRLGWKPQSTRQHLNGTFFFFPQECGPPSEELQAIKESNIIRNENRCLKIILMQVRQDL